MTQPLALEVAGPKGAIAATAALLAAFGVLYFDVIGTLVSDWAGDDDYSHGFLIVPLTLYLAWERREALMAARRQPSVLGLVVLVGSVAALVVAVLAANVTAPRLSILGVVAGTVLFVLGWKHLKVLAFPIAMLLLMIPLPMELMDLIAFPLQLLASSFGEQVLSILGIPVLREGNVIVLANTQLEVARACSGIRSLISLLTLGIVYGYFVTPSTVLRLLLALATIPIAITANALRVAGTGVAAHYYGAEAAQGFFHSFSGWLLFLAAFAMLFVAHRILVRLMPGAPGTASRVEAA